MRMAFTMNYCFGEHLPSLYQITALIYNQSKAKGTHWLLSVIPFSSYKLFADGIFIKWDLIAVQGY